MYILPKKNCLNFMNTFFTKKRTKTKKQQTTYKRIIVIRANEK